MPAPVLLGIPWLASVLGSLFLGIVTWLATYVTKRLAILVAAIAALAALTATFLALVHGAVATFNYAMPATVAIGMVVPSNAPLMLAAYMGTKTALWVYQWNVKIVQLRLF